MAYSTKQQQAVMQCLLNSGQECMTVVELADQLRRSGNPVGIATIYRQLEKLEQSGHIHKLVTEEGAFYQYCSRDDGAQGCFLLKCEGCGRVLHLDCARLVPLYDHLEREHHFTVNPHKTVFTGLCASCAARKKEEESHGIN